MPRMDLLKKITTVALLIGMLSSSSVLSVSAEGNIKKDPEVQEKETVEEISDDNKNDNLPEDPSDGEKKEEDVQPEDPSDEKKEEDELPETPAEEFKFEYGVDISRFQGTINFELLANDQDVRFAIIRAGTSGYGMDSRFLEYYNGLSAQGVKLGAYLYVTSTSMEGFIRDANRFIEYLKDKKWDMPVFLDLEDSSIQWVGKENLVHYTLEALNILREAGYTAGVYSGKWWFSTYLDKELIKKAGYEIWQAHYVNQSIAWADPMSRKDVCDIWQYTSEARNPAIKQNTVDMNISYKKYPEDKEKYTPHFWISGGEPMIRLRIGPGLGFRQIDSIRPHMKLVVSDVMEADGYKWGLVRYNGMVGWCTLDYSLELDDNNSYILNYDLDEDGFIDGKDAARVSGNLLMSDQTEGRCDANGDGEVDVLDYLRIKTELLR